MLSFFRASKLRFFLKIYPLPTDKGNVVADEIFICAKNTHFQHEKRAIRSFFFRKAFQNNVSLQKNSLYRKL